jgi:hypothetical protein
MSANMPPPLATQEAASQPEAGRGSAIAALVLAVLAFILEALPLSWLPTVSGLLLAAAGVIFGHVALGRASRGSVQGLAVAALAIGYIAAAVSVAHLIGLGLLSIFTPAPAHHALKH